MLCGLTCAIAPVASSKQAQDVEKIDGLIRAFVASRDASDGRRALEAVEYVALGPSCRGDGASCPQTKIEPSPQTATWWLELFATLDSTEAELAKKLKPVYMHVAPPIEGGIRSPGEVSPSEIKNPTERKQYEDAIAKNERNRLISIQYAEISQMRKQAGANFWVWAPARYHGNSEAVEAIAKEAEGLGCTPQRIEKIRAVLDAPSGTFPPDEEPTRPDARR